LIHGELDTDVPHQQSVSMAETLERNHIEYELKIVSGQGHGFDHADTSDPLVTEVFNQVMGFLEKYTIL
jgi:dipeptidyl aminopeptidase/acylaminoacyl peptidase